MALAKLTTKQGAALSENPWQVYPRPQLKRDSYLNLNGTWELEAEGYQGPIRVPFCPESQLSGVEKHFPDGSTMVYRRSFTLPVDFNRGKVLLHFGAVDQIAEVYVNQKLVGSHTGGYESFSFDITDALKTENALEVRVVDDLRDHILPYGKQTLHRGGMWYTPVSGIWQTVWLESVPENYVNSLSIQVTLDAATITVTPALNGTVTLEGKDFPLVDGTAVVIPDAPHLWTPEDPYLYHFTLCAGEDTIESYFALRTLESKTVDGIPRLCLNGKSYFFHGLLDQGYWPDGLFTPAAPECYAEDIWAVKALGFNTLRKHIKVEPEQFYYDCDRLGMVVFQDMVNNGDYSFLRDTVFPTFFTQKLSDQKLHSDPATRKAFLDAMEAAVRQLQNHPSICYWTIFNEAWGQFDSAAAYRRLKELDSSRFIDSTSGWFRGSESDVESLHIYFGMWHRMKPSQKPIVLSEFGGFTYSVDGHIFNPDKSYGYGTCKTTDALNRQLDKLYREHVIPAVKKGLCASIYTQISDVEDEINGMLTYDRKVTKVDPKIMNAIAADLQSALHP